MATKKTEAAPAPAPEVALETIAAPGALVELDYGEDAGKGYEHQTKADSQIPFLVLMQGLSPQVRREEAKIGDWVNTVTQEVYSRDKGFLFVPATTRHYYCKWIPRDEGGGFRGHLDIDEDIVMEAIKASKKFGKYKITEKVENKDGKIEDKVMQLVETFYVYGAICSEEGEALSMACIAASSTKIRPYKSWMTRLRQFTIQTPKGKVRPPLYANLTRIASADAKNNSGEFKIPTFKAADPRGLAYNLLPPDDERFLMAKECMMLLDSGKAKIDYSKSQVDGDDEAGGGDIPF